MPASAKQRSIVAISHFMKISSLSHSLRIDACYPYEYKSIVRLALVNLGYWMRSIEVGSSNAMAK